MAGSDVFVGRDRELATLQAWWDVAPNGAGPQLTLVAGESGVGKTRLVDTFVDWAAEQQATVLRGACHGTSFLAYEPWVAALREFLGKAPREQVAAALGSDLHAFARIPWIGDLVHGTRAEAIGTPTEEAVAELVSAMLARLAADARVLLVLEDIHWADRGSVELLRRLSGQGGQVGYMIAAVERRPATSRGAWHDALDAGTVAPAQSLVLDRLDKQACALLLQDLAPAAASPEVAAAVYASSGGNAYMARELALIAAQARDRFDALAESLPQTAAALWLARLEPLSRNARRDLAAASVVGIEFDRELLAHVSADDVFLDTSVGEAQAAGLIEPVGGTRYRFGHAMLRDHLYSGLAQVRRQRIHRRVARAIEADHAGDDTAVPLLAYHYVEAGNAFRDEAARYTIAAARRSFVQGASDTARDLAGRALGLLQDLETAPDSDPSKCARHRLELGDVLVYLGHPGSREVLMGAVSYFEAVDDLERLADCARVLVRPADASVFGSFDPDFGFVERLIPRLDEIDPAIAARVLIGYTAAIDYRGESEQQRELSERAISAARLSADPDALAAALNGNRPGCEPHQIDDWLRTGQALVGLGRREHNLEYLFQGLMWSHNWLIGAGDAGGAEQTLAEAEAIARQVPRGQLSALRNGDLRLNMDAALSVRRVTEAMLAGRFEEGQRHLDEVSRWASDPGQGSGRLASIAVAQTGLLADDRGRLAELKALVDDLVAEQPDLVAWQVFRSMIAVETEDYERARLHYGRLVADGLELESDSLLLTLLILLSRVAFDLCDPIGAGLLSARLRPYSGRTACGMLVCAGPIDWALGMCAATLGHRDEAEHHFETALALMTRMRAPSFEARIELSIAEMLAREGSAEAAMHANRAREIASSLEMARIVQRAEKLL